MVLMMFFIGFGVVAAFAVFVFFKHKNAPGDPVMQLAAQAVNHLDSNSIETVREAKPRGMPSAQHRRRRSKIHAYVGLNGAGKTLTMVVDTIQDMKKGRRIYSTMALFDFVRAETVEEADRAWALKGEVAASLRPADPLIKPYWNWIPFYDWRQLLVTAVRGDIFLVDEIQGVADGRQSGSLPTQVSTQLYKLRARGITFRWTTIDYSVPDKRLRDVTRGVTYCKGYAPDYSRGNEWGDNRIFWLRTYKSDEFDNFTQARQRTSEKKRIKAAFRQWITAKKLKEAFKVYDTMGSVLTLGVHNDAGMCMSCGGRRTVPACTCPDHVARKRKPRTDPPAGRQDEDGQGVASFQASDGTESGAGVSPVAITSRRERRAAREAAEALAGCAC